MGYVDGLGDFWIGFIVGATTMGILIGGTIIFIYCTSKVI